MVTVTLQQIKDAHPCTNGWKKVLKANGGKDADMNKPFPLVSILDTNDLDDTLWVVSNVPEMSEHDELWQEFSAWCALQNIEKIAKYCSTEDYQLIVEWLETRNPELRDAAWAAVEAAACAARSAAWSAARSAARSAAEAAARSAAWSAARSAAWAARSAAEAAWATRSAAWSAAWSAARAARSEAWAAWAADPAARSAEAAAQSSAQEQKLREILEGSVNG